MTIRKPPRKRLASLLLSLALLLTLVPAMGTTAQAEEQAATGTGTADNPYVVYTYDQLWNAMDYRGSAAGKAYIKLGCNIDTSGENSGYGLAVNQKIQMQTYNLTLDLNGYTLAVKSSDSGFQAFILQTGNMTICDSSSGGGTIRYTHTRAGDRQLIRIAGGYTLTLTDGVTLEVNATSHGACINAVLWLGGYAHANIINANLLHVGDRSGETSNPRNWATGVLVEDSAALTIHNGEFTRVVVNKPPVAGGDKDPNVIINGGVFRRPLAIFAGNTLNKTGPLTLPIRINGGVFHRIDEPRDYYKQDGEEQFFIYVHAGSEENFFNFDNQAGSAPWEAEVSECMKGMQRSIFPKDAVIRLDDADIYQSGGSVLDIGNLSFTHIFSDIWLQTSLRCMEEGSGGKPEYSYPDKIEVYSGLFDVKAKYGGENVPTGTSDAPFVIDRTENDKLTVTWNTRLPAGLPTDYYNGYKIRMHYSLQTSTALQELTGTDNGNGTSTAIITLPEVDSGSEYIISLAPTLSMVKNPGIVVAGFVEMLHLKSQNTIRLGTGTTIPFTLSGPLKAGDTVGPEIKTRADGVAIETQGAWRFLRDDGWEYVDVSADQPLPVNRLCSKKVTLKALPGYKFETGVTASLSYGGTSSQTKTMTVSEDGKTATVEFSATTTADYEELKLTITNVKVGGTVLTGQTNISGLPKGITPEGNIIWREEYNSGSTRKLTEGEQFYAGRTYQCELFLHPDEGVTVPTSVTATINGITATYAGGYEDGNFTLTSDWFTVPDPRTPITGLTLLLEDELSSYTADTNLLIPVAAEVKQFWTKWLDSTGKQVAAGTKLTPETEYTFQTTYMAKDGYRLEPDVTVKLYGGDTLDSDQCTVSTTETGNTLVTVTYRFTTPKWSGATIYGGVTSYGSADDPVCVKLERDGQEGPVQELTLDLPTSTAPYRQEYTLTGIVPGNYTLTVTKKGHEPHVANITYPEGAQFDLMERVELHLLGSANVRGKIVGYGGKSYSVELTPQETGSDSGQRVRHLGYNGTQENGRMTGEFVVDYVAPGTYDLVVHKPGHLDYTIKGVVVKDGVEVDLTTMTGKPYQTITLLAGDVNGDGSINESDVSVIRQAGNINKAASAASNPEADVNGDGSINESDVSIVRQAAHINKGTDACTYNFEED